MKRNCKICEKEIEVKTERIGSGKSEKKIVYSDDGIYFEDDKVWFCTKCNEDVLDGVEVDYLAILNEDEKEVLHGK